MSAMVQIEEDIPEGDVTSAAAGADSATAEELLPSQERMLDAHDLERAAATLERPTARLHLTALATKLRREAETLQRIEKSRRLSSSSSTPSNSPPSSPSASAAAAKTVDEGTNDNLAPSTATGTTKAPSTTAATSTSAPPPPPPAPRGTYVPVDRFAFDAGGYNAPFVTLYIDLPGVGSIDRQQITCHFTKTSVDLIVLDLNGKSHRLFKDNLEKDINPDSSKILVKADKILVKLAKVKSDYGSYDHWSQLSAKKSRTTATASSSSSKSKDDPQQSIMQLMKDMYDDGDDNMRKIIGETMLKQRTGELGGGGNNNKNDPLSGMGMGGAGFGGDNDEEDF